MSINKEEAPQLNSKKREAIVAFVMLAPALVGLAIFVFWPSLLSAILAFTDFRVSLPREPLHFIGFSNFINMFQDRRFIQGLLNTLYFVAVDVPTQSALALGLALLANRKVRGSTIFRAIYFVPNLVPMVVAGVIFSLLLNNGGVVNSLFSRVGIGPIPFLTSRSWAMPSIILTTLWHGTGFQFVIFLAGLQTIPQYLYEAARIDGANAWQQFRAVTLPQLKFTIILVLVVTTIYAFRLFTLPYIMTHGGPVGATRSIIMYMRTTGISTLNFGYASAMSVFYFLIVLSL